MQDFNVESNLLRISFFGKAKHKYKKRKGENIYGRVIFQLPMGKLRNVNEELDALWVEYLKNIRINDVRFTLRKFHFQHLDSSTIRNELGPHLDLGEYHS